MRSEAMRKWEGKRDRRERMKDGRMEGEDQQVGVGELL